VGRGVVRGIVIRGNTFLNHEDPNHPLRGTLQGIGCFDGFFEDWVIENNVVITDHWHGITLLGARNCRIVNNTVVDLVTVSPGPPWIQIGNHKDGTASTGNLVRNNLTTDLNITAGSATVDHNLEFSNPALHFRNYAARDLRLIATSTAIDQGSANLAPTTDHAGLPRPLDGLNDGTAEPDIGAFEFAHPARDSDGDGISDADEAICGTSPLEASDIFKIRGDRTGADLVLWWPSLSGRAYTLHASADPGFSLADTFQFAGSGRVIHFTNVLAAGPGFFKLEVRE
jgi:parallel beta-helix repeat protein